MDNRFLGESGFPWFFATVVNLLDPDKMGQVQIRIQNLHDDYLDEELPWAIQVMPPNMASFENASLTYPDGPEHEEVGVSPTGIMLGSTVIGFFADGATARVPFIVGTFHGIKEDDVNKHDVSRLAREINTWEQIKVYIEDTWSTWEPPTTYATKYPNNKVYRTQSGHAIEIDDTPDAERIHIYHKSGTYTEISADGRTVNRITGNNHIAIDKDDNLYVNGNVNIQVNGNVTMKVAKNVKAEVGQNFEMQIGGTCKIQSGGPMTLIGSKIDLNP